MDTVDYIKNLSGEEISKLKREEVYNLVKDGYEIMTERLDELDKFRKGLNIPKPIVMKQWGNIGTTISDRIKKYGLLTDKEIEKGEISYSTLHLDAKSDDTREALLYKLRHIQGFLKTKSSTPEGWQDVLNNFYKRVTGKDIDKLEGREYLGKINYRKFWEIYNNVQDLNVLSNLESSQVQKVIYNLRVEENMSMKKIEDMLLYSEPINARMELEEMEWYTYGDND